jgi:CRP-like cAMP-binding protein
MFNKNNHDHEVLFRKIKSTVIFESLSDAEINALLKIAHVREYAFEEKVFSEGTVGLCFYIIVKGSVKLVSNSAGEEQAIREYGEGDFFSEIHLFSESNHNVTCAAKEVTKLIVFSKPDLEDLVKIKPKLGNKLLLRFLDFLAQKLDKMYEENIDLRVAAKS